MKNLMAATTKTRSYPDQIGRSVAIRSNFVWCLVAALAALVILQPAMGQGRDRKAPNAAAPVSDGEWTIVLGTFTGENHPRIAAEAAARIQAETGLAGVRVEPRGKGTVIAYGVFAEPTDAARAELERVRRLTMGGLPVFASAFLAPPPAGSDVGLSPMYHLLKAKEEFGPQARYSLQVAVYESPNREEAMRAAEQAAVTLRREGEAAFYYHGHQRSMVTIGAFRESEVGAGGSLPSPALEALQRRHPLNLLNGNRPLVEKPAGATKGRNQPSFLVAIPDA